MSDHTVATLAEYTQFLAAHLFDEGDEPERTVRAVGSLAADIRERLGAARHAAAYLTETDEPERCRACNHAAEWIPCLSIECGDESAVIHLKPNQGTAEALAEWLDEPRRAAEERARREAEQQAQRLQAQAREQTVIDGLTAALSAVETEGYADAGDWHDKLMTRLGVKH